MTTENKTESCPRCEAPGGPVEVEDGYEMTMVLDPGGKDMFVVSCGLCHKILRKTDDPFSGE